MMFGSDIKLHTLDSTEKGLGYISLAGSEPYKFYATKFWGKNLIFVAEIKRLKNDIVNI